MSESSAVHIHAKIKPAQAGTAGPGTATDGGRQPIRIPSAQRLSGRSRHRASRPRLTRGDRLLRNSAIACAVLLGILALGNLDEPWAQKASQSVERALTMHIDLDQDIGALTFVRRLMPESALVFLNISGDSGPAKPVEGTLAHPWSNAQPWLMFSCPDSSAVCAVSRGTVTAVSPMSGGRYGVLVDHGEGLETVYASLASASVKAGDTVERGQALGTADGSVYFEYRQSGESVDPAGALGL